MYVAELRESVGCAARETYVIAVLAEKEVDDPLDVRVIVDGEDVRSARGSIERVRHGAAFGRPFGRIQ